VALLVERFRAAVKIDDAMYAEAARSEGRGRRGFHHDASWATAAYGFRVAQRLVDQ
jgi:SRSO17 transposase